MEAILASVRRILAEDERNAPARDTVGVLELTEALNNDGSVRQVGLPSEPPAAAVPPPPDGRVEPEPPRPGVALDKIPQEIAPVMSNDEKSERLVSSPSSGAAAAAFAQLANVPRERREGDVRLGGADQTLEEVVRDLLRPMLQTWLDEHLPAIVERLVRAEIARVVDEAGLR